MEALPLGEPVSHSMTSMTTFAPISSWRYSNGTDPDFIGLVVNHGDEEVLSVSRATSPSPPSFHWQSVSTVGPWRCRVFLRFGPLASASADILHGRGRLAYPATLLGVSRTTPTSAPCRLG